MGEWAPLPPHGIRSTLSGGCLKSLGGVSGKVVVGGGPDCFSVQGLIVIELNNSRQ